MTTVSKSSQPQKSA